MSAVMEEKTVRGLREIALLVLGAIALFFLIALITFDNEDAGWSHSGSLQTISNACGVVGAWCSDFMLSIFGLMAYLFPVMIFWHGYLIYTNPEKTLGKFNLVLFWIGFLITLISGCAIFYLHILRLKIELPGGTGGILGQEVGDALLVISGNSGATLLLLAVFLAGITLFTGLSWFSLLDFVGKYTLRGYFWAYNQCLAFYDSFKDRRAHSSKVKSATYVEEPEPETIEEKPRSIEVSKKKKPKVKITPFVNPFEMGKKAAKESQADLFEEPFDSEGYEGKLPPLALLDNRQITVQGYTSADLEEMSRRVEDVLQDFNVVVEVVAVNPGPVITRFELKLAAGVKVSRVNGLSKDIARGLSVTSVRIVEVIQGKSVIGLEIPNREREMVSLRDLLASRSFEKAKSKLTFAMGKDIAGIPVVADLGKMPHALVAGTTGSGKSVAINTMILSLLYKATPEEVRLIMIDPKMLELSVYEGIPHLLTPVVTDMKDAQNALRWAVAEMERRYKLMSKVGVRNLAGFNAKIAEAEKKGEPIRDPLFQLTEPLEEGEEFPVLTHLPSIVIVIDELADMMMIVGNKLEELIAR
jgi:S-DNA-T family DNA segregation ATPase FtsK/SpoIIIE